MFPTESTWMKPNRNPVCSTRDIAQQNLQSKSSDSILRKSGTMDIGNASFWNPNYSNEKPSYFFKTGMINVLNSQLLNDTAISDLRSIEHLSAYQPPMSSSSVNSNNWLHFDACRSMIETQKADCVFGNAPVNEDSENSTLVQDFKVLTEIGDLCANPDFQSIDNSCLFDKKKRKRKTAVKEKDHIYWERRQKNNLAAKKSRDMKREKEERIEKRLTSLEIENKRLQLELSCLFEQNKNLKQVIGLF